MKSPYFIGEEIAVHAKVYSCVNLLSFIHHLTISLNTFGYVPEQLVYILNYSFFLHLAVSSSSETPGHSRDLKLKRKKHIAP